jgi:hypothetical protein
MFVIQKGNKFISAFTKSPKGRITWTEDIQKAFRFEPGSEDMAMMTDRTGIPATDLGPAVSENVEMGEPYTQENPDRGTTVQGFWYDLQAWVTAKWTGRRWVRWDDDSGTPKTVDAPMHWRAPE